MGNYKDKNTPIILFDGYCNLCSEIVQFVIKKDRNKLFGFAPLQSDFGKKILMDNQLSNNDYSSFILYFNNTIYTKSTGALTVAKLLGNGWQLLYAFIIIPRFIRDAVYSLVAKYRYYWFGKKTTCWMPENSQVIK